MARFIPTLVAFAEPLFFCLITTLLFRFFVRDNSFLYESSDDPSSIKINSLLSTNNVINTNKCEISICKSKFKEKLCNFYKVNIDEIFLCAGSDVGIKSIFEGLELI